MELLRLPSRGGYRAIRFGHHSFAEFQWQQRYAVGPSDQACYTCHTDYELYGGIRAKVEGMRHVYVQYLGKPPAPANIRLYTAYNNRECLHCHEGARSFVESPTHTAIHGDLTSNQISCLTSGCHNTIHNIAGLDKVKFWSPPQ